MVQKTQFIKTKANRTFTDREEFVDTFNRIIKEKRNNEYRVINYYGLGGIGKTSLIEKLQSICANEKIITAMIDFDVTEQMINVTEMTNALISLRNQLKNKCKFYTFEIAYAIYLKKVDSNYVLNKETFPFSEDASTVFELIDTLGGFDIFGISQKILKLVKTVKKGSDAFRNWYIKKGNDILINLENISAVEILEIMPYIFAQDISYYLENNDRKLVIFLDTYEALWAVKKREALRNSYDNWIRKLIAELPEVLWIICGRDKLTWAERTGDNDWNNIIESHIMGKLSDSDAKGFLISEGITDELILQRIIKSSAGIPYNLDLNIDIYQKLLENHRIPLADDFPINNTEIYNRLIKHLSDSELATLEILTQVQKWNYTIFDYLVSKYKTAFTLTHYPRFCEYSFVENLEDGYNKINPLMTDKIEYRINEDLKLSILKSMQDYFTKLYEDGSQEYFDDVCFYKQKVDYKMYQEWRVNEETKQDFLNHGKFIVRNIKSEQDKVIIREEYIDFFEKYCKKERNQTRSILLYYGMAGIGKTVLKEQLIRQLKDEKEIYIEFKIGNLSEDIEIDMAILYDFQKYYFPYSKQSDMKTLKLYDDMINMVNNIAKDKIVYFFIDDFDMLIHSQSMRHQIDNFKRLFRNINNARWILFSRSMWFDELMERFPSYLISRFSQLEIHKFLHSYGIYDIDIKNYVLENFQGNPLFTDVFVECYVQKEKEIKRKPTLVELKEMFSKNSR